MQSNNPIFSFMDYAIDEIQKKLVKKVLEEMYYDLNEDRLHRLDSTKETPFSFKRLDRKKPRFKPFQKRGRRLC